MRSSRSIEILIAAALTLIALAISPYGLSFITGRAILSFRVTVIALAFDLFLLAIVAAMLARGRLRRIGFHAVAWTFPVAMLAALEGAALYVRLADRVAPLEDTSILRNKTPWPTYLLSEASAYRTPDGLLLFRPWQGPGITFNALGLRTAMPQPKAPGEWRLAVSGGSAVWGWRVFDADTIPVQLQDVLRRKGYNKVTVYNFGIGGVALKQELALLEHFRDTYALDQVLFYTGANDVFGSYVGETNRRFGPWAEGTVSFELIKTAVRLQATWSEPAPEMLQWLDSEVLPPALKNNILRDGILAADAYCRSVGLVCDFALQPMMYAKKTLYGPERRMQQTLTRVYPRLEALGRGMYRDAIAAGPAGHVFDLTRIFDGTAEPLFLDQVHVNEDGNRIAAESLVPIVAARFPQ